MITATVFWLDGQISKEEATWCIDCDNWMIGGDLIDWNIVHSANVVLSDRTITLTAQ